MNQDPLLDKMDALLKKHRGNETEHPAQDAKVSEPTQVEEPAAPPPDTWLPVLTDVVVMGNPASTQQMDVVALPEPIAAEPESLRTEPIPQSEQPSIPTTDSLAISDTLAEQLMEELEPRLSELLQDKISAQIHHSLDDAISALLAQLDVNIREIVREAIQERLGNS